ncbi:hypothetical protein SUGI_0555600 [Cryptomeria japonica]|nr:hypothetical protein SUGI_0555600 [Cryptomeria japonica]
MANISAEIGPAFNYTKFRVSETEGIDFLGDATVSDYVVHLTNINSSEYKHCKQSSGRIVCDGTIQLSSIASFSTHFVFSMYSHKHDSQGEGIAFFLSSEGTAYYTRSCGLFGDDVKGCFRLCGDDVDKIPALFAVVFSSVRHTLGIFSRSSSNGCYNSSHNSVSPLNNGTLWDAWIDYNSPELRVYLSSGSPSLKSPQNCIFSDRVKFSQYVRGNVSIGFSSAVLKSTETHNIFSWSFNSTLYSKNTFIVTNSSPNCQNNSVVVRCAVTFPFSEERELNP